MNDITALEQSHELLIANGNETANLLRHLANNEIDSDYFAVVSECESYGQETEAELSITDFALRAAGYVDALVEALEAAEKRIAAAPVVPEGCKPVPEDPTAEMICSGIEAHYERSQIQIRAGTPGPCAKPREYGQFIAQ